MHRFINHLLLLCSIEHLANIQDKRFTSKLTKAPINEGSNPYWFAFLVEYEDGDGDLGAVSLKQVRRSACHLCS